MGTNIKKKVLFLGVGLYNYDTLVLNELSKNYDVSYIYLAPIQNLPKWKYSLLVHLKRFESLRKKNEELIMQELKNVRHVDFDYIFVIKGSRLNNDHISFIKANFPKAKRILYLWDSWQRIENQSVLTGNFDCVYSFDTEDCKRYGFILRPLFYSVCEYDNRDKLYDISFVGTIHSDRLEKIRMIRDLCLKNHFSYFLRLKTTGFPILCAWLNRGRYKRGDLEFLTSHFLTFEQAMGVTRSSKLVIDFQHPDQSGLTIRTIEALAMGCKLITTNKYIKQYCDIPQESYYVLEDYNLDSLCDFIRNSDNNNKLPINYSLTSFLSDIIS